jgi:hypothetical protein
MNNFLNSISTWFTFLSKDKPQVAAVLLIAVINLVLITIVQTILWGVTLVDGDGLGHILPTLILLVTAINAALCLVAFNVWVIWQILRPHRD